MDTLLPEENPNSQKGIKARPPEYLSVLAQRRQMLHADLSTILSPGACFVWEVGCGHGHFLAAYAAAHPERICIGVDLASERIERALRKRDRARLINLHFIRAEARLFLESLPDRTGISDLFILFPDPWPKLRHQKHRVLHHDFLNAAAARATPGSQLYFRTDFKPYFEAACATVRTSASWELLNLTTPWPFEFATVFQIRAKSHDSFVARRRPTDHKLVDPDTRQG